MNIKTHVATLEAFALTHYEEGGHWVYETYSREDYEEVLAEANWDLNVAIQRLKQYWELYNQRERECSWGE